MKINRSSKQNTPISSKKRAQKRVPAVSTTQTPPPSLGTTQDATALKGTNFPCALIQDLLPLYVEELTSKVSNQLITEHLDTCPLCEKEYRQLVTALPPEAETLDAFSPLSWRKLQVSKWLFLLFACSLTLTAFLSFFSLLSYPVSTSLPQRLPLQLSPFAHWLLLAAVAALALGLLWGFYHKTGRPVQARLCRILFFLPLAALFGFFLCLLINAIGFINQWSTFLLFFLLFSLAFYGLFTFAHRYFSQKQQWIMAQNRQSLPLVQLQKTFAKRRRKAIFCGCCAFFLLFLSLYNVLSVPFYLPYDPQNMHIREQEDQLSFEYTVPNGVFHSSLFTQNGDTFAEVTLWTTRWNQLFQPSLGGSFLVSFEPVKGVFYLDYTKGGEYLFVHGENPFEGGGAVALPRLFFAYYLLFAVGLSVLLGLGWLVSARQKKPLASKVFSFLFFLPVSYLFGQLLIQGSAFYARTMISRQYVDGFITASYHPMTDFTLIFLAFAAFYGFFVSAYSLMKQKRLDRRFV
ncbi:MAG: hypothetical protein GX786_06880 [Clostridiales bacterium]|nr:hypothetical protein [Clostridiales bacterium]